MNVIDKSITALEFIHDSAEKGQISTYDNGHEKITVENIERLTVYQDKAGKVRSFHELGRLSGVIRGKNDVLRDKVL